jgi:hypothetical protein
MSDYTTYTVDQMLSDIKVESRNNSNTELDAFIVVKINQLLVHYAGLKQYEQFFIKDYQLNLTAATSAVALPANLQHLNKYTIRYLCSGDLMGRILSKYDKYRNITQGPVCQFVRQNSTLLLTPFVDIETGDYLLIDYWQMPPILAVAQTPNTIFPVPDLVPVIQQGVCAQVVTFDDPKQWQRFKAQEKENYIASLGVT